MRMREPLADSVRYPTAPLLPSQAGLLHTSRSSRVRVSCLLLHVLALGRGRSPALLCPLLTSGDASSGHSTGLARRHIARSPRVMRTHLHAYACRIYAHGFRTGFGLPGQGLGFEDICLLARRGRLICDFCSSSQHVACGFLQIPPRGRHPCRPANSSSCQACRGLAPSSESPCRAHKRKAPASVTRSWRVHCLPV
jgi:hypothetical protein